MSKITIITPTFNRQKQLHRLYLSLKNQSCKDFDWLIIDDGSTDETSAYVKKIISENELDIRYIHRENGGKHRALNQGVKEVSSELIFIVDSDDVLPNQSIEIILKYHDKYKNYNKDIDKQCKRPICGYSFLRCHEDGSVNTAYFPKDEFIDSYLNVRINGRIAGDKAEVFYSEILKSYPFKEFEGENFMPEDALWMKISEKYDMVHINENVYICEYLEGGLTKTGRKMKIKSPLGMMYRSSVYIKSPSVNIKTRIKMIMLLLIYGRFAGRKPSKKSLNSFLNILLYYLEYLPSYVIYSIWLKSLQ